MYNVLASVLAAITLGVAGKDAIAPEVCEAQGHVTKVGVVEDLSAYSVRCSSGVVRFVSFDAR